MTPDKCKECSSTNLFWNKEKEEVICKDCGFLWEKKVESEVKLCRLRDVSLHILELATEKTDRESYDTLDLIDHDIKVYIKNFIQFCEDNEIKPTITFVGDNDKTKKAVVTG